MLKKLNVFFKQEEPTKTDAERIAEAKGEYNSAVKLFTTAQERVEKANENLDVIVNDLTDKIKELDQLRDSAVQDKDRNVKFAAKLAEFIN